MRHPRDGAGKPLIRLALWGIGAGCRLLRDERGSKRKDPRKTRENWGFARVFSREAPVGVEPTMADLQSAALATWLRSRISRH